MFENSINVASEITVVFLAFLFCSQTSCKPKEQTYPPHEISEELLRYLDFDEGSWWIYQKNNADVFDTIEVIDKKLNQFMEKDGSKAPEQELSLLLKSTEFPFDTFLLYASSTASNLVFARYENGPSTPNDNTYFFRLGMIPFTQGATAGNSTIDTVYALYGNNAGTFQNVVKSRCTENEVFYNDETIFYFNEKGIIRKEFVDQLDVYELVDYHLVQ